MDGNKRKRCDTNKLSDGDWLFRESYIKILGLNDNGQYRVCNERGFEWSISPNILEEECYAADQFTHTETVTATELAKKLKGAGPRVFLVEFHVQPSVSSLEGKLAQLGPGDLSNKSKRQRVSKDLLQGRPRRLVGHLVSHDTKMGRSMVRDLELDPPNNVRQIDHRHIVRLVLGNVQYLHRK